MIGDALMIGLGCRSKRLLRLLICVVVAYVVAAQGLLIVLAGFSFPAHATDDAPGFELCVHESQDASKLPAGSPDHSGCTHCILCSAGPHHAVIGAPLLSFHRAYVEAVGISWVADQQIIRRHPAHSIASPRGPPLRG